ncbi:carbonic anhydrase [Sphingomonas sp.]|jgi:carbonic anhydrase|uniref:carbonic anhydrase n=1 Tax=Sphingomonas sp. TaxID=28214 RepID=UPI002DE8E40F|nr:carbonic anhydrase [Sphingomonas sp.]
MTQAFDSLIAGYRRFRETGWRQQRERWAELKEGQAPRVMVIACSDSRVDPSQIFDTSPGEMFVVRNVAAMVPPFETGGGRHGVSAALEFAVTQLEVAEIVIMGHGACGGVNAALTRRFHQAAPGEGGFIAGWMELLDEARDRVLQDRRDDPNIARAMELEAVKVSLANLRTFPFVEDRVQAGTLKLHGAYFAIADGMLHVLGEDGAFRTA